MKKLFFTETDPNDYKILIDDEFIGRLTHPRWYSSDRDITLSDGTIYFLRSGFWDKSSVLQFDGKTIFELYINRDDKVIFKQDENVIYLIARERYNSFKNDAVLLDGKGNELLNIHSRFSWREFETQYIIRLSDNFGAVDIEKVMIVLMMRYFSRVTAND